MRLSVFIKFLFVAVIFMVAKGLECKAYDFSVEHRGNIFYLNITSSKTCEFTYKEKEDIDGSVVYNKTYTFSDYSYSLPRYVDYDGKTYEVTGIGDHAFENTNILRGSCAGEHITYIGMEAFKNCENLRGFGWCYKATLGERVCENCVSLKKLSLSCNYSSKDIVKIPTMAFHGCSSLEEMSINNSPYPEYISVEPDAFDIIDGKIDCTLYLMCPEDEPDFKDLYKLVEPWCFFTNIEYSYPMPPDPDGVEKITVSTEYDAAVYNLYGQRIGTKKDLPSLPRGIYIVNGKKVVR